MRIAVGDDHSAFGEAPQIAWTANPQGELTHANRFWGQFFGFSGDGVELDEWRARLHPDDAPALTSAWQHARAGGEAYHSEARFRRADGSYRWLLSRAVAVRDEGGAIVRWPGVSTDITEQKQLYVTSAHEERRYRMLADAMPQIVWTATPEGRMDYTNRRWSEYTGVAREAALAEGWHTAIHPDDRANAISAWAKTIATLEAHSIELRVMHAATGRYRWNLAHAEPIRDENDRVIEWVGALTDIDSRKRREEAQRFLAEASRTISNSLDVQRTLDGLARVIVPDYADWSLINLVRDDGELETVAGYHPDPEKAAILATVVGLRYVDKNASVGSAKVVRSGTPQVYPWLAPELEEDIRGPFLDTLHRVGFESAIIVPFIGEHGVCGTLHAVYAESGRNFSTDDLPVFEDLARRVTIAIENGKIFEREHRVAEALQRASLPAHLPSIPGMRFHGVYEAGTSEALIGGDWYDALRLADGRIVLSIGDVAGSGLGAAVMMGNVRQVIRGIAQVHADPALMLDAADKALRAEYPDRFVTAFVGVFDPVTSMLTYASAGHPPPYLRDPSGHVTMLEGGGLPLGLRGRDEPHGNILPIALGSMLALYTDGLIEATRDLSSAEERLMRAVSDQRFTEAEDPAQFVRESVLEGSAHDDIAILTMALDGPTIQSSQSVVRWAFDVAEASDAQRARAEFTAFLATRGTNAADLYAAELIFGELLGNVVRHAPGSIEIVLDWNGEAPVLHILDQGPGFQHIARLPADPFSERGRGLYLISSLADDFHVSRRPGNGSHARAVLSARARRLPAPSEAPLAPRSVQTEGAPG